VANNPNREYVSPTLGDLAGSFSTVARESFGILAVAWLAMTASYTLFDQVVPADSQLRMQWILSIIGAVIAYALTRSLLATSATPGALPPAARIGGYIGLAIVTGLGTIIGLVLLVVPGLILAARWLLAAPILLAEETTVGDAMSHSWDATAGSWGKLIVAQLIVAVPLLVAFGVIVVAGIASDAEVVETPSLAASLAGNAAINLFSVASVVLAVAAYRAIVPTSETLAEVFA